MPTDSSPNLLADAADHPRAIPRVVSLIALVAVLVLTGLFFFKVMALFVVPLFLAGVLVVIFEPVFKWFVAKLPGKKSLPALCTTAVILLAVLLPCVLLGWQAFEELSAIANVTTNAAGEDQSGNALVRLWNVDFDKLQAEWQAQPLKEDEMPSRLRRVALAYQQLVGRPLTNDEFDVLKRQVLSVAGEEGPHSLLVGLKAVGSIGLGLLVMTVAVFYFFVDGPAMIQTMMHLSPLDDAYEEELLERFAQVSRAVVVATLLSAVVQGLLAGIGYYFAMDNGPIFLLTVMTMLLAMVPFVGAMAVWGFVAIVLFVQGQTFAAVGLAIYGAAIVSTADNVIKPIVLHGQSKLHPLLALLSVLGGVTALGPIGILVGPMLVAFLQALLTMLRKELENLEEEGGLALGAARVVTSPAAAEPAPPSAEEAPPAEDPAGGGE
ncbi:putative inner membrane protein [Posidoniimonas corsicana]|uniref:Putative inner membrane protein n=1 Tax=Posidoniimonas corsicana TaxID=1938618 RepID=A0A5C5VIN2_9BACT|nr:AI-2E family transporter [Posidoniimonas corsicana]TWT37552.1 putative inner membrane protein [Posidoniimonas corsicana]